MSKEFSGQISDFRSSKGIRCRLYKWNLGDCSNGGISGRCDTVTLVDIGVDLFSPDATAPAVKLVKRNLGGQEYIHAVPVEQPDGVVGPMFGGTFIYTSDSRFPSQYPIALHDRFETQEQYNALSR